MKPLDDIQEETLRQVKATKHYAKQTAKMLELLNEDNTGAALSAILTMITEINIRQRRLEQDIKSIHDMVYHIH